MLSPSLLLMIGIVEILVSRAGRMLRRGKITNAVPIRGTPDQIHQGLHQINHILVSMDALAFYFCWF